MPYLLILLLTLLIGCGKVTTVDTDTSCLSDECRREKLVEYCSFHDGLREFSNIDKDHYYAICNDNTYVIIAYDSVSTFVLDLNEFK